MNWNDLPVVLAIARAGSLAGAARALGVNHSTVFRRLNAVEEDLGVRLFERYASGYTPTEVGRELLPDAERAADAVDALARRAAGRDLRPAGDVRLTTAANLAIDHLPDALADLARTHPDIRAEVVVSDSDYDLSRREADLALRATRSPPEHLIGRKVIDLVWHVVGTQAYLRDRDRPATVDELEDHRLIGADSGFRRLAAFAFLHRRFGREQFVASSNSLNAMAAMARAGLGLAVLPSDQVDPALERLMHLPVADGSALWLLTHPDLREVARIRAVSDAILARLRSDPRLAT